MSLSADFPAEQSIEIPDNWEKTHKSGIFWIVNPDRGTDRRSHNKQQFRPREIFISTKDGVDDSTWAEVNGILWGENDADYKTRRLACNVVHPIAYKAINMKKTNARGITIFA